MRYQDYSPIPLTNGKLPLGDRLRGILKYGLAWPREMQSQETVVALLRRALDNRFTIFRNIPLADGIVMPLLLVGPTGVAVINPDHARGIYRAHNDNWLAASGQSFVPAKPNIIRRTALFTRVAATTLEKLGYDEIEVEGILACTNPGIHVETVESAVRVLLIDAIEPFGARLMQQPGILSGEQIHRITATLSRVAVPDDDMGEDAEKIAALRQQQSPPEPSPLDEALNSINQKLKFSTAQWIILAVLLAATILLLLLFWVYVVYFL